MFPVIVAVLLLLGIPFGASAQLAAAGQWVTADGQARVATFECGGALCGRIVWLKEPVDESGRVRRDVSNPYADLRNRPLLGLQVLTRLQPDGPERWSGGTVYVPEAGREYRASISMEGPNILVVRRFVWLPWLGWLPWLSSTERWIRVSA
ncbi:MAG: DUF2147 domain-containing protein [Alphaproteobacteria bacterium]|nr:DUF2147 domain-containing protein [Alphaproteobacteria bacterium]